MIRPTFFALLVFVALVVPAGSVVADGTDDVPHVEECYRFLFLHWVDYSHHYLCVNTDPDEDECYLSYKRQAPDGTQEICIV